jgi:hypothetical protein
MSGRTGARASLDALLPISEFPDGLNPVFVRDLRQGLRAPFFMWAFVLLHGFAIIATMAAWAAARVLGGSLVVSAAASGFVTNLIFGFLLPLSLFHSLQPELGRGRNAELLLTSRLSRWQIVRGKLLAHTTLSGLLLVSLSPYFLIRYFLGSVGPAMLFIEVMALIVANATMNAIVIGASAFSSYLVRFVVIFLLGSLHSATAVAYTMKRGFTGSVLPGFLPDHFAGQLLVPVLYIVLSLQLGRARLQPARQVVDPVAKILAVACLAPVAHAALVASATPLSAIVFLCLMVTGALLLDRDAPQKKS